MRWLLKAIINAVALWLTTLILAPHFTMQPFGAEWWQVVLSYLGVAVLFGIVNAVVGTVVRIVAFPLYILTLGLVPLVVNALLLFLVAWLPTPIGWGLHIETFWWGVLAVVILSAISWILGLIFRPLIKREGKNHR